MTDDLAKMIDAVLPQMQCGRCGYPSCQPYAAALSRGSEAITKCTPGGTALVAQLAELLGHADEVPPMPEAVPPLQVAAIVEQDCIGCTKCIQVCPVAAILGAAKKMHSVLSDLCTGCELCLPACPVDCIVLRPAPFRWDAQRAASARRRFQSWSRRSAQAVTAADRSPQPSPPQDDREALRAEIAAAVARRRAQR